MKGLAERSAGPFLCQLTALRLSNGGNDHGAALMKTKAVRSMAIAIICAATASQAQPPIVGVGQDSCSRWLLEHERGGSRKELQDQWLGGFLSAYNVVGPNPKEVFFDRAIDTVPSAISGYCRHYPKATVSEATFHFMKVIHEEKKRRNAAK
jgi:hypothetical protein